MKKMLLYAVTAVMLLISPHVNFAQAPDLGTAANFVLFTTTGAIGNTGTSQITGYIGTNNGAITGFEAPTTVTGNIDSGNAATVQCSADLLAAYYQLFNTAPTSTDHAPAFGSGETLFAGVYSIAAAGSVAGDLTLDAEGNTNAVFIFKFGGAFTTGASTTIHLINAALACNVFWEAEGAISMAAVTAMKGTLIANNGAISMGAGGTLEGRMFSTTGAASIYAVSVTIPACIILSNELLPLEGTCNREHVMLKWRTATETNNNYFIVERSMEGINWQMIGMVTGAGNSSAEHTYTFTDSMPNMETSFYRLKQTDFNGSYKYGNIVDVERCRKKEVNDLTIYPNPSGGKFKLLFTGNSADVNSIEIFNPRGQKVYKSIGLQSKFDLSCKAPGIYFMRVQLKSKTVNLKIVIEK